MSPGSASDSFNAAMNESLHVAVLMGLSRRLSSSQQVEITGSPAARYSYNFNGLMWSISKFSRFERNGISPTSAWHRNDGMRSGGRRPKKWTLGNEDFRLLSSGPG